MITVLTQPWETHVVPNKYGLLNNPWGMNPDIPYDLMVTYDGTRDLIIHDWDTGEYPDDPSKVLAYPEAYWGIADVAFPTALPYPEFIQDLNGETDYDVWIDTKFNQLSKFRNNYAIESFRYSGLPRKGTVSTTTHEIMLWLQRPGDDAIGRGNRIGVTSIEGNDFGVYIKSGERKYIAFIADSIQGVDGSINWSQVLRLAQTYFDVRDDLDAFDLENDKNFSIEAGPEIWGASSRGIVEVSHNVYRKKRGDAGVDTDTFWSSAANTDTDTDMPSLPDAVTTRECEWMSLQANIFQMEHARAEGRLDAARRWHGLVDKELAEYYDRYLK